MYPTDPNNQNSTVPAVDPTATVDSTTVAGSMATNQGSVAPVTTPQVPVGDPAVFPEPVVTPPADSTPVLPVEIPTPPAMESVPAPVEQFEDLVTSPDVPVAPVTEIPTVDTQNNPNLVPGIVPPVTQ